MEENARTSEVADMKRVLLTNQYGPYPRSWGTNSYDITETRFHRGQGAFALSSHIHCLALYLIAENIKAVTTVVEYPRIEDFEEELRKGYDYWGIQMVSINTNKVADMMRLARRIAPQTKIIIGGYGVLSLDDPPPGEPTRDAQYILEQADYICREEGIRFMRRLLGDEPVDRPITQKYPPRDGTTYPGLEQMFSDRSRNMALVALGCPNGCEFCCTSAMFKRKKIYVATPQETFESLKHNCRRNGGRATTTALMDEDFLMNRKYVHELGKLIQEDKEFGLRKLSYFCFGDLRSMTKYSMEELLENGVDTVWIGVESSIDDVITSEHNIAKRKCDDIKSTFRGMEEYGIGITASLVLGWDFHTRENIERDIDFFVDLKPSAHQITFLGACPGTKLYERMKKEGRINPEFAYKDIEQCNDVGSFIPKNFKRGELKHYFDLAHTKLYEANGPGIFRMFQLNLNGYETCSTSHRPLLRKDKAPFFEERCRRGYPLIEACAKYAPNEGVRQKVDEAKGKYLRLFGEPDEEQKVYSKFFCETVGRRAERLKTEPPDETPFDPPVRRTYYDPSRGPVPLVKKGRGPGDPVPYNAFDEPEHLSNVC
ncbi:MAG: radical SAM protein [Candidatus Abyssobacteria bacterium SURF_5]|uniref:Radical SAM protein n=1 Tax=Abyssobacteria bacterium (strain SURF_5) TaxID=2093360 RepID=A0A3A4N7G7_ABYX5|nr:MAG: radical SAM protein [Candidatus Abyssubacteria bacterium SURF_5]